MTADDSMQTYFAPTGRASQREVTEQFQSVQQDPRLDKLLDRVSDLLMVLNRQRQIVYGNQGLLDLLSLE